MDYLKRQPKIYAIKFKGKVIYIGQTSLSVDTRYWEHLGRARSGRKSCPKLYMHMRKNKFKGYTFEMLEIVSPEQADARETFWISSLETKLTGCNTTPGGKVAKGKDHYMWGKKARPETVAASVAAHKGKPLSQAWKDAIGRGNKGKKIDGFAVVCVTTGEEYPSINAAAKSHGVTMFTMQHIVYGKSDPTKRRKLKHLDFKLKKDLNDYFSHLE